MTNKININYLKKTKAFKNTYSNLINSTHWSKKKIQEYQFRELKKILKYCYENVPYYTESFNQKKFNYKDITSIKHIEKIPFLTKELSKKNNKKLISKSIEKKNIFYMTTGGTTGNPLKVWMNNDFKASSLATTFFYMKMAGFKIGKHKSIRLHGDLIDQKKINKKIYWQYEKNNKKKLIMSSHHLSEANIVSYLDKINEHKPEYIHSYPSVIFLLARYIKKLNYSFDFKIKTVFTDCEVLYDEQKKLIKEVLNCKIFNIYGHTEGAVFGFSLKANHKIFLLPTVGIFELVDKKNKIIKKNNQRGEVVVTGFLNNVFPMIRYKTQDIASYDKMDNKFKLQVLSNIEGRKQDYLISKNNAIVPIGPALFDYNFDWSDIDRFQILQKKIGEIIFYIIVSKNALNKFNFIKKKITNTFEKILNFEFKIKVIEVKKIEFTKIGKFRYLKQNLNIDTSV